MLNINYKLDFRYANSQMSCKMRWLKRKPETVKKTYSENS